MTWIGEFSEDFTTVPVYFTTHDSTGAPVAPLTAFETADFAIYKNGSATQKTSTNGLTITSPFDSLVGLHQLLIDTSNDTGDTGFWVTGATYAVILNPDTETVAGQVPLKVLATFGIDLLHPNLQKSTKAIGRGTATTGGSTTSIPTSAFSPSGAVADQYAGRVVLFDSDTTTSALRGQARTITASSNAAAPTFTVAALTTAPSSGDVFSVL